MSNRAVITVIGKDRTGIVAGVSDIISKHSGNILDISQTILQEFFAMIMLVEIGEEENLFAEFRQALIERGKQLDVQVMIQHEDVFKYMHRI